MFTTITLVNTSHITKSKLEGWRNIQLFDEWSSEESVTFSKMYFSLLGEGNSNPLQYSCLENPMDGGTWLATVYESRVRHD